MRFVFSSLFVLAVAVPVFASVDTELLALVPSNAQTVGGVDVTAAKSSPFGQYLLSKISSNDANFEQMLAETGFDPRRDIADVLFVGASGSPASGVAPFGILMRGNFDQARVKATLAAKGASVQTFAGTQMLVNKTSHGSQSHGTAFAFADVDVALIGDLATVEQMLSNRSNPSTLDPALAQLVASAGANNDAWVASLHSALTNRLGNDQASLTGAEAIKASGGIKFGSTVDITADAVARSPKDATSLADVMRMLPGMFEMPGGKDPKLAILASAFDNMTITASGNNVHVALSLPESSLEQVAEAALTPRGLH